ncbi:MAG: YggT family protein [Methylophaga sp.]
MTNAYIANPLIFIIESLFYLYMVVVALRLVMQWANWEYHNPLVQFVIKASQAPVKFLRQFLPSAGRWDTATLVLLVAVIFLKLLMVGLIAGFLPSGLMWLRLIIAEIFSLFISIFTVSIIIEVILSWVTPPGSYNPVAPLVQRMNAPLLRPVRRLVPPLAGVDLSPLFVILGLQVLSMLIMPVLTGRI